MKKLLYIFLGLSLMFACSDGPEIIVHPCVISDDINDIGCIEIYEPVCGYNDVTYSRKFITHLWNTNLSILQL